MLWSSCESCKGFSFWYEKVEMCAQQVASNFFWWRVFSWSIPLSKIGSKCIAVSKNFPLQVVFLITLLWLWRSSCSWICISAGEIDFCVLMAKIYSSPWRKARRTNPTVDFLHKFTWYVFLKIFMSETRLVLWVIFSKKICIRFLAQNFSQKQQMI